MWWRELQHFLLQIFQCVTAGLLWCDYWRTSLRSHLHWKTGAVMSLSSRGLMQEELTGGASVRGARVLQFVFHLLLEGVPCSDRTSDRIHHKTPCPSCPEPTCDSGYSVLISHHFLSISHNRSMPVASHRKMEDSNGESPAPREKWSISTWKQDQLSQDVSEFVEMGLAMWD